MEEEDASEFNFAISLSVLNHLGRNLYRNFITVLGEAISNSWDADANNVWISFDKNKNSFYVKDDGNGMNAADFQNKFLKIGYSKRKDLGSESESGRPFIGAKGIGKLALLSCAERITIFTRDDADEDYVGGVIDNSGLDEAITDDLEPGQYQLEQPDENLLIGKEDGHETGTIIVFEGADRILRTSEEQIRKLLALSFHFSLLDEAFTIHVNGKPISLDDLQTLTSKTEFVWKIESYDDEFKKAFTNLKEQVDAPETELDLTGFIATVEKPSHLNIRGKGERATVDLFVNGRLREKNILSHLPSQRIVESYVYGQIHFNSMDGDGDSPFTSSREGVVADDDNFVELIDYLKSTLFPQVIDQWDELRIKYRQTGDDENKRKSVKDRKAAELAGAAKKEFKLKKTDANADLVEKWLDDLEPDAEFNLSSYADCFLSENLIRKYVGHKGIAPIEGIKTNIKGYRETEEKRKEEANISFDIRRDDDDLSYLGMDDLAFTAEGSKDKSKQSLWLDAINFKPVRNAVGHTGTLTDNSKAHLKLVLENIKGRLRKLLKT
ncbi:molecular chaperone Hsp90 [Blastomonas marina]|uniref:Molecular chaperone Hsp90 n=1 Tax=Blastomonas marina TaxID=1867408 RepID=A0ABQ1F9K0_9SPHN|nr:ATP-binding protein [Blastomonas marina]GGA02645.1 molecular chaperone Hsp90 [Blastomonas marina]